MRLAIAVIVTLLAVIVLSFLVAGCEPNSLPVAVPKRDMTFLFEEFVPDLGDGGPDIAEPEEVPDLSSLPDLAQAPRRDFAPDPCQVPRASCRAHLAAGCVADGPYHLNGGLDVWCNQLDDGGGWLLGYVNSNNWLDAKDAPPAVMILGKPVYAWYASVWHLSKEMSPKRLGRAWNGQGALRPETVGGIDLSALYKAGFVQVRYEFVRGSDGKARSGWCETADWHFEPTFTGKPQWCRPPAAGSGHALCLSTTSDACDALRVASPTWASSVTMESFQLRQAYGFETAPNQLALGMNDWMVARYEDPNLVDNAVGENYLMRVWVREP